MKALTASAQIWTTVLSIFPNQPSGSTSADSFSLAGRYLIRQTPSPQRTEWETVRGICTLPCSVGDHGGLGIGGPDLLLQGQQSIYYVR